MSLWVCQWRVKCACVRSISRTHLNVSERKITDDSPEGILHKRSAYFLLDNIRNPALKSDHIYLYKLNQSFRSAWHKDPCCCIDVFMYHFHFKCSGRFLIHMYLSFNIMEFLSDRHLTSQVESRDCVCSRWKMFGSNTRLIRQIFFYKQFVFASTGMRQHN